METKIERVRREDQQEGLATYQNRCKQFNSALKSASRVSESSKAVVYYQ